MTATELMFDLLILVFLAAGFSLSLHHFDKINREQRRIEARIYIIQSDLLRIREQGAARCSE